MNEKLKSFATVSKDAPAPLYQQIKDTIATKISAGHWIEGQKLPSESELVVALGVSRMTIHRALRELTQEGLISRVHGVGSFVAGTPHHASLIELKDIAIEIEQAGMRHTSRVLSFKEIPASTQVASKMLVNTGAPMFFLKAVHFRDKLPIQLESRYVNPELVPEFIRQDFSRNTSTSFLLKQFRPEQMEHIVRAISPDKKTCQVLQLDSGEPCLQLSRRTWRKNRIVTWVSLTYPGSRYELGARYATDQYHHRGVKK